ncbi:MAG: transposase [Aphanocapsa lilacina HA4352-LM1]|jgi:transposase-like protein|nr:transposase [Aphanocapsa lilacina HA4352-LM1]
MSKARRSFSPEFKLQVVREVEAGSTVAQVARLHELHPNLVTHGCTQYRNNPQSAFVRDRADQKRQEQRVAELEQMVGKLTMESQFLKGRCPNDPKKSWSA